MICCESRRCGGDRDRGSRPGQQRCDVLFHLMDMAACPNCLIASFRHRLRRKPYEDNVAHDRLELAECR
jgi:hypothetical protein